MKVSIVLYVLNEVDGLKALLPRIKKDWCDQLLVIDGGSTDGSVEYLREVGCETYRQELPRWGGAYMEAFKRATGDIIVDFSPDGNCIPEKIPELIAKVKEGYDLVVGSRYAEGAKSEDDSPITGLGNLMFSLAIALFFRVPCKDSLGIFRAYRRSFLDKAGLLDARLDHGVPPLLTIRCGKVGGRYAEVPADEPKRLFGVRKMNILVDGLRTSALVLKELLLYPIGCASRLPITF